MAHSCAPGAARVEMAYGRGAVLRRPVAGSAAFRRESGTGAVERPVGVAGTDRRCAYWRPGADGLGVWAILHEPLGSWPAPGGVIVLVGIYLARRASLRQRIIQEKIT